MALGMRTMALPVGRGALTLGALPSPQLLSLVLPDGPDAHLAPASSLPSSHAAEHACMQSKQSHLSFRSVQLAGRTASQDQQLDDAGH
jgi:hypothetical protein